MDMQKEAGNEDHVQGEGWADDAPVALTLWQSEPCGAQPAAVDDAWTSQQEMAIARGEATKAEDHPRTIPGARRAGQGRATVSLAVGSNGGSGGDGADGATKSDKRREKEQGRDAGKSRRGEGERA
jgi:hypothetical protein